MRAAVSRHRRRGGRHRKPSRTQRLLTRIALPCVTAVLVAFAFTGQEPQ